MSVNELEPCGLSICASRRLQAAAPVRQGEAHEAKADLVQGGILVAKHLPWTGSGQWMGADVRGQGLHWRDIAAES